MEESKSHDNDMNGQTQACHAEPDRQIVGILRALNLVCKRASLMKMVLGQALI